MKLSLSRMVSTGLAALRPLTCVVRKKECGGRRCVLEREGWGLETVGGGGRSWCGCR